VFLQKGCFCCHGTEGQGGAGPRLAPDPRPIAAMAAYVRHPTGLMPTYQQQITDEELSNIRAYLNSIPAPRPVRDIPQLNE
jgi:mono/diheme cytochrome c family protein